jgi:hypothetical protein
VYDVRGKLLGRIQVAGRREIDLGEVGMGVKVVRVRD